MIDKRVIGKIIEDFTTRMLNNADEIAVAHARCGEELTVSFTVKIGKRTGQGIKTEPKLSFPSGAKVEDKEVVYIDPDQLPMFEEE